MSAEQIVLDEFGCYYLADDLDVGPGLIHEVPALAAASAERLALALGAADRAPVIALLRELRDDPAHRLHRTIGHQTLLRWSSHDWLFRIFQQIADEIIIRLEQGASAPGAPTREVEFEYGNEHNPVSSVGRIAVSLTKDGDARLSHWRRDRRRQWRATQRDGLWATLMSLLDAAAFPRQPDQPAGGSPPDTPAFSLTCREEGGRARSIELAPGAASRPHTELKRMFFALVDQFSTDILDARMPPGPTLVTDVVDESE
ncbi:MAG: hypothetical protein K8W52_03485 [Deltaproteobacteria bacterium]|nr:hypothetical protein [Deltaproteobacteria bacterium]